jgi:hypothetical protein
MLDIFGRRVTRSHDGVNRRDFLRVGTLSMAGLTLADWLRMKAYGHVKDGKAKTVIQLWMGGGPTQLETFDPKPEAGSDYCGPMKSPIPTNVPGIRIGELLPLLAKQADKYSIVRSFTHNDGGHETAAYTVATGNLPSGDLVYPSIGAVVSLKKGYDAGYQGKLPPYVAIPSSFGWFSDTGFLGQKHKTFATGGDPNDNNFRVQGLSFPGGVTDKRLQERHTLLQSVDSLAKQLEKESQFQAVDSFEERAYGMVLGEAKKAFDMSQEKKEVREKYGRTHFGQCCLLARRLVEQGVPFITINSGGWDTHTDNFGAMKNLLPPLDKGLSALIEDLAQRGLLQSTVIVWYGEFGRTPKISWEAPWNGGRHHWPYITPLLVAGGGFKGGAVVGSSDEKGEHPKSRPLYPWDLTASIYKLLGIDANEKLPHPQGCVAYVTPLATGSVPSGGLLSEIM